MAICAYVFCNLSVPVRVSTHGGRQHKYCSKEHKDLVYNARRKARRRVWNEIECKGCSVRFSTYVGTVEYCEDKCRVRFLRQQESYKVLARLRSSRHYTKNKKVLNQKRSFRNKIFCECGNQKTNVSDIECGNCTALNRKILA